MNTTAILTIIRKEWAELYKNSLVLSTVLFMPLVFTALPLAILFSSRGAEGSADLFGQELPVQMLSLCAGLTGGECSQVFIVSQFLALFMMIPAIIPATIAPFSIVGEKTQRSLEPLLATPISTAELLAGKNLAATLPAILATWLSFALFAIGARLLITSDAAFARLLDARWLIVIFIAGPLLAVLSVNVAAMVSARSNDPRVAQQVASLIIFPVIFLFFGQLIGFLAMSLSLAIVLSALLLVGDLISTYAAVRIFDREAILTRWG